MKNFSSLASFAFFCAVAAHSDSPAAAVLTDSPPATLKFVEGPAWKAVDLSDALVRAGSPLDLSSASAVAFQNGRLPRLVVGRTGRLEAEGRPGEQVRLNGFTFDGHWALGNWGNAPDDAELDLYAKQARVQGYNLFRFMQADALAKNEGDMRVNPALLDRLDRLLAIMGRNGVYMHLTIFAYAHFMPNIAEQGRLNTEIKTLMYLGDPQIRAQWRYGAETLMKHVNPHAGLAWKDDPSIACVEFHNEQEFGLVRIDKLSNATLEKLNSKFQSWLEAKYKTPSRLADAWGDSSISSFEKAAVPAKGVSGECDRKTGDFIAFCDELAVAEAQWCESVLRNAGYKGLTSQYNLPNWFGDNLVRFECSQVALRNNYFHHPRGKSRDVRGFWWGDKCDQVSSVGESSGYWRNSNVTRFADRPFFMTEYNHPFWNRYQYECGLLFGAYSAFQGFDAIIVHDRRETMLKVSRPPDSFCVDNNPVARAGAFLSACLFLRRDVKASPHRVDLEIPNDWASLGEQAASSGEQDKIGLLCGFASRFPNAPQPEGVGTPPKANLSISPSGGALVQTADWFAETIEKKGGSAFSLDAFASLLKRRGVLPPDNASCPSKGVFQSDTGEITMRSNENLLKVAAPRVEALAIESGKSERVGLLALGSSSEAALVAACSVDGENLAASHRIVLLYSTVIANSGMELSGDRVTLLNLGALPVLMKTGRLNLSLKNANASTMSLYALGVNGLRLEKLPLKREDGSLEISLDTASLKNGPTPFFELAAE